MVELTRNTFVIVSQDELGGLIRAQRTSAPITSVGDLYEIHAQFLRVVPIQYRMGVSLLMDLREAPMLTNEALEAEAGKVVDAMASGFERAVLLVRSAVGVLQARRVGRSAAFRVEVFDDEGAAVAYLNGSGPAPCSTPFSRRSTPPPPGRLR